jgi:hypothetical protein
MRCCLISLQPRGLRRRKKKSDQAPLDSMEATTGSHVLPSQSLPPHNEIAPLLSHHTSVDSHPGIHLSLTLGPRLASKLSILDDPTMPPHQEIIEGVESRLTLILYRLYYSCAFAITAAFSSHFQLSPVHRPSFMQALRLQPHTLSKFLVVALLSMSARKCPSLIARFGGALVATDFFLDKAVSMGEIIRL